MTYSRHRLFHCPTNKSFDDSEAVGTLCFLFIVHRAISHQFVTDTSECYQLLTFTLTLLYVILALFNVFI